MYLVDQGNKSRQVTNLSEVMETKTQVSACSADLVPLPENLSQNMLDSCDTLSMSMSEVSLPTQILNERLPQCYVRLVRLSEDITPTKEFNCFKCVNTSQQYISSKYCHNIELDNHLSYCSTCKHISKDFHQFKQNVQSQGNESSFCRSTFNDDNSENTEKDEHKDVAIKNEETCVNMVIKVEAETNSKIIRPIPESHFDSLNNSCAKKVFEPHLQNIKTEIFEATDPIVVVNLKRNFDDEAENTQSGLHEEIELKDEATYVVTHTPANERKGKINIYKCTLCQKEYTRKETLNYHMKSHTGEQPFKCKECNRSTKTNRQLRYHYWTKHNKPMETEEPNLSSICSICSKYCGTSTRLKKHMSVHTKPYKCSTCNMSFSYRQNLKRHVLCHTAKKQFACHICQNIYTTKASRDYHLKSHTGEKPYRCKECEYSTQTNKQLRYHCWSKHNKPTDTEGEANRSTICSICGKYCGTSIRLKKHMLAHKKPYKCGTCNMSFSYRPSLKRHVLRHTSKKRFECHICHNFYTTKSSLDYHLKSHTGERPFHCTDCDYSAQTNKLLRYHCWSKHNKPTETEGEANRSTICSICGKYCGTPIRLKKHMLSHEKPYKCNLCKVNFSSGENLKRHVLRHTSKKRFECYICQKRYKDKASLEYHIKFHSDEKPHRCTKCDYSSKTSKQVRHHYIHKHVVIKDEVEVKTKTNKIFRCRICDKGFTHQGNLKRHMLGHTGEKPFECDVCHNRYTSKISLEYHLKSHTREKPFRCTECDYSAKTIKEVRYHYDRKHALCKLPPFKRGEISVESYFYNVKSETLSNTLKQESQTIQNVNQNEVELKPTKAKSKTCHICNRKFPRWDNLKRHMLTHTGEKQFECDICQNRFTSKNGLNYHIRTHTGEKPFKCKECNYSARERRALQYHYKSKHTFFIIEEVHIAPYVDNAQGENVEEIDPLAAVKLKENIKDEFEDMENDVCEDDPLEPHFLNIKSEIMEATNLEDEEVKIKDEAIYTENTIEVKSKTSKVIFCPTCNKTFSSNSNLKRHVMICHTGEKPFKCEFCQNRYTTKNSLEYHLKSHTGEKPFRCTECDYSAKMNKQVREHYNRIHATGNKSTVNCT